MHLRVLLFIDLALMYCVTVASDTWPNEPAGSHPFLDCPMNNMTDCRLTGGGFSFITDGAAPMSPSNVAKSTLAAGASTGGSEVHYSTPQIRHIMAISESGFMINPEEKRWIRRLQAGTGKRLSLQNVSITAHMKPNSLPEGQRMYFAFRFCTKGL